MVKEESKRVAVVAVGGNSLITDEKRRSVADQYEAAAQTMAHIADLIEEGYTVVITHGNGPQVGFILLRSEIARTQLHPVPLDSCVADTQGAIGYQFQMALGNELLKRGIDRPVVTVVTQVRVDEDDPGFRKATKPIGPFYSEAEAKERRDKESWQVVEDAGRGWRRVVASPKPLEIIEESAVRALVAQGFIVVAVGGGGVPVVRQADGSLQGVAAVIDKDLASSLLANRISADLFIISTAVDRIYLNYNTPQQRGLDRVTLAELEGYAREGHFKPGSMLPKVQAVMQFLRNGGGHAIVTDPGNLARAVRGEAGTHIVP